MHDFTKRRLSRLFSSFYLGFAQALMLFFYEINEETIMKKLSVMGLVCLADILLCNAALATHIDFQINGIKQAEGKLYIQLFSSEESYKSGEALMAMAVAPQSDSATVRFNDVQPGEYALRFFHDENNNGQMESNLFGIPTEGYGFSNNAKPSFGPVSFKDIKFTVSETTPVVTNVTNVIY
jgi:uncharacterized protein (DUF2141 family)